MQLQQRFVTVATAAILLSAHSLAQISFGGATNLTLQGAGPVWIVAGDFDGDMDADFAVSVDLPSQVEIYDGNGAGSFALSQTVAAGNGAAGLVAADFDRDGDLDLALASRHANAVQVLTNSGGVFTAGALVPTNGTSSRALAVGDINADGDLDLVVSNRESQNISLLSNDGSGAFALTLVLPVGLQPRHIALDDLNGDCDLDIAVAAHDSSRIDLYMNTGAGTFNGLQSIPVPGNEKPTGLVASDLDQDGDVDLATTIVSNNLGALVVFTNNGTGSFGHQTFATSGLNPEAIVAFDFDVDGAKDLALVDADANLVSALSNTGGTTFGAAGTFAVGTDPGALVGTDLDGNGSVDLLTSNRDSNNVSILLNAVTGGSETYCDGEANSAGAGARIDSFGTPSVGTSGFTLTVRCAPPNHVGLFFYGAAPTNVPFGSGRKCVDNPVARLTPVAAVDAQGRLVRPVAMASTPITAGSTWRFQFWYRDTHGAFFVNESDALRATFVP
jgi:hypothetical protein